MKLNYFKASDVYGYMDFDINFNKDVNFLIGTNGSGKTTVIKLIRAILEPRLSDLISISFGSCQIGFYLNKRSQSIEVKKNKASNKIEIIYDNNSTTIDINSYQSNILIGSKSDDEAGEYLNDIDNEMIQRIKKLPKPIILGVDRKSELVDRSDLLKRNFFESTRRKLVSTGLLGDALYETQIMIQDSYKGIRGLEEKQSGALKDSILKSSFKFTSFDQDDFNHEDRIWKQTNILFTKKDEILKAVNKIVSVDDSISSEVDSFFQSLDELLKQLKESNNKNILNVVWLMNKAQINRILDIVEVIDSYEKKIQDIYKPVNEFIDIVNQFFKDSNKKILIDPVGRILIRINGHRNTIGVECLSSGERQLIIIIANVLFNKYGSGLMTKRSMIIIDEPELSLHMRWQEIFSDLILTSSPETQFILATHSPDIVGEMQKKCIPARLVK